MTDTYSYKESVSVEEAKQILEKYKKTLSDEHNNFVKKKLKGKYETVTRTVTIWERSFTGTFKEDKYRKNNRRAYKKETKIATILASKGFDIVLLKESSSGYKKPDALVNGIVMDFKEITGTSKNALGNNYQNAMRKKNSQGAVLFLVNGMTETEVFNQLSGKTRTHDNGIVIVYHEDTDKLQIINMKNLRAAHERTARIGMASGITQELHNELGAKSQSNLNINPSEKSVNKKL